MRFALLSLAVAIVAPTLALTGDKAAIEQIVASPSLGFGAFDLPDDVRLASRKGKTEFFEWSHAYFGFTSFADWRPYTAFVVKFENRSKKSFVLRVEVRDASSHDYWSRANLTYDLVPGVNEIRVPTELFAGEAGRPGRALDRAHMKSVIFARDPDQEGVPLRLLDLRFKREARARDAGVYAWDFGPDGSAVFPGFESVNPSTTYSRARGFGLVDAQLWQPYREACRARGPDSLLGDCLMIARGGFRADLPKGRYRVYLNLDHPGPFWGEFPVFRRRQVKAQGKLVVDERDDAQHAFSRFFSHEKTPAPRDANELYANFVSPRQHEKVFELQVGAQGLRLDFLNEGCPQMACFGLALTHVIAVPIGNTLAEGYVRDLAMRRREEFASLTHFEEPIVEPLRGKTGFDVESPDPTFDGKRLAWTAFRNGPAFAELRLRTKEATSLSAEFVPETKGLSLDFGWGQDRLVRLSPEGSRVGVRERHVDWKSSTALVAARSRSLLLAPRFAPESPAGLYRGKLFLRRPSEEVRELLVEVRLLSRLLPETDIPFGPFGHTVLENWRPDVATTPRGRELERASLARMREAGLSQFSFNPVISWKEPKAPAKLQLDTTEIDRVMRLAKAGGFRALVAYGNVFRDFDACRADFSPGRWAEIFGALEARSRLENWLPLTIVLCDEPEGDELKAVIERSRRWPSPASDARVTWTLTTHVEKGASVEHSRLSAKTSMPFLADFALSALPKTWTYYNDLNRWSFGLRAFALARNHGLRGRLAWTWNQNAVDPFNPLDGREDDYHWCTSLGTGDLICTLDWHRNVERGVRDYRRAQLLVQLLSEKPGHSSATKAKQWLADVESRVSEKTLSEDDLDALSARLDHLLTEFD